MKANKNKIIPAVLGLMLLCSLIISYPVKMAEASGTIKVEASHPAMNTIKLSWNKVSGASGYHVYYSETKNGTYELVSKIKDTSIVFENLTTDTLYYFKVAAYTESNGVQSETTVSDILTVNSNSVGIDVSKWNGTIDWAKVKADNIDFAIVRVAYGTSTTAETKYKTNIEGAIKAGIPVGVYIYSTATSTSEAKKEAEYVLSLIKGYNITYPVVFDIEDSANTKLSKSTNTNIVKTFCNEVKAAGYTPMVYTGCSFSETYLTMSSLTEYDWWIAHYASTTEYKAYSGTYHFRTSADTYKTSPTRMWQYSQCGKVNGISGNVDMNYELDLDEETDGMVHVDVKTGKETYVAASGETLKTIATKLGLSVTNLVKYDDNYTSSSTISAGKSITIYSVLLVKPVVEAEAESDVSIKLSWEKCFGADGYYIYHSTSEDGTYTKIKTTAYQYYTHKLTSLDGANYYKVVAYKKSDYGTLKATSAIVGITAADIKVSPVTTLKAASSNYSTNKISWSAVEGADGYRIYSSSSKSGTYKLLKTTTSLSYSHKNLPTRQYVYYKVTAYKTVGNEKVESDFSSIVYARPSQPKPTNFKMTASTENTITLSWSAASNATIYQIYRSTSLNGTYTKVANVTATTYTNKKLTLNQTYYYKIRAIRKVDGKNYYSFFTSKISAATTLSAPKITSVNGYSKRVQMNWSTVKNATGYEIYRATSQNGTYKKVIAKSAATINNTGLESKKTYYYKVRAYRIVNSKYVYSAYSSIVSVKTL